MRSPGREATPSGSPAGKTWPPASSASKDAARSPSQAKRLSAVHRWQPSRPALTLTREDLQQFGEEDLPSPTGLLILPHPLLVRSVTGEYAPGSEIDDPDDLFMPRFLFAFWRLCEQRIVVPEHAPVNHSAQVLADRAGVSPQVRIVRLRRAEQPADPETGGREWKHRWTVRMHKVNQWYPSEGRHRVIHRGPTSKDQKASRCSKARPSAAPSANSRGSPEACRIKPAPWHSWLCGTSAVAGL